MKRTAHFIFIVALLLISFSCKKDNVDGVILENTLVIHQSFSQNRDFISLVKSSLNKDPIAFKKLNYFPTGGAEGSYNQGYVVTQIIYRLGEKNVLKMISSFDNKDLNMLESMINVGLEYGDNNYDNKMDELMLVNEFPKLNRFINEKH